MVWNNAKVKAHSEYSTPVTQIGSKVHSLIIFIHTFVGAGCMLDIVFRIANTRSFLAFEELWFIVSSQILSILSLFQQVSHYICTQHSDSHPFKE